MKGFIYFKTLLCLTFILAYSSASAGYLISPVRLYLKPEDKLTTLNITNGNDTTSTFQLAIYKWTRENGKDVYTESKDLLVTPIIFNFAPDKTQLIRIAQKHNSTITTEQSYRLFLKEVPSRKSSENNSINVVLQFGIPIFLVPSHPNNGELKCKITDKKEKIQFLCKNTHNQHVLITSLASKNESEAAPSELRMSQYVFPNEESTFSIDKPAKLVLENLELISSIEGKRISQPVTLE